MIEPNSQRQIARTVLAAQGIVRLTEFRSSGVTAATVSRMVKDGEVMRLARERSLPVVVDPKYRNFFRYRGATIFKPNVRELEAALGAAVNADYPETLPATVVRVGVEHILLTLGERGMTLFSEHGEVARLPTHAREVYDVVGAGDTVTAYLASMLAAGASASEAATIANIAAGIEVGKLGAATVTPSEITDYVDAHGLRS